MAEIVHVISGLEVGGAEMALLRLIVSSKQGQFNHRVIALTTGGGMWERFKNAGVEVIGLDFRGSPVKSFARLVKYLRTTRPDVVQTWMYHADFIGGVAARLAGIRNVIWGIHSTYVQAGGSRMTTFLMRMCARVSRRVPEAIVCVAQVSRDVHIKAGYDASRMLVIPNGVDLDKLVVSPEGRESIRRQYGLTDEQIVIGTLGRFNPAKDYENFVSAAGIIARQYPFVRFLMVGRGLSRDNAALVELIARTGYDDRFVLLGERDDAPVCLAAMDIFCLSSRSEALPTVIAEAMSLRLPCVATDVGDTASLLGEAGVVVPKEDASALAGGMARLIEMAADCRRQLGELGRQRIEQKYTMIAVREQFERLYTRLIEKAGNL
ncbi:MAG: glycosyltransferase family 4 protein [Burkholderiaceae bacterium]